MLGRQQIRGAPAAVSELFKNAHDAYAAEVRADYLRYRNVLAVRDDGIGMSTDDFLQRWLALGTESRLGDASVPTGRDPRPVLGEKGIGRLAIAVLGPQVLVATRAEGSDEVTLALINWEVFEQPVLNLEDIRFPYLVVGPSFGDDELSTLRSAAAEAVEGLPIDRKRRAAIVADIAAFPIDSALLALSLPGPSLRGGSGTAFVVAPVMGELAEDIDREGETPDLVADLIGFANPIERKPVLAVSFVDWIGPGRKKDLIGNSDFWNDSDFQDADHEIRGQFDANGFFSGQVRVYRDVHEHTVPPPKGLAQPLSCGPFELRIGYMQGLPSESIAEPQRFAELAQKLGRIHGVFVYRDGIRILPYGRNTFDWLDIELNRSKGAGYYFFSYRRMFGYVAISKADNSSLEEKAGREGFRENRAYRQFRELLKGFLVQLAADFFRGPGAAADNFNRRREELSREAKARAEREKRAAAERKRFSRRLSTVLKRLASGAATAQIARAASKGTRQVMRSGSAPEARTAFETALSRVGAIREGNVVLRPSVGLTEDQMADWDAYMTAFDTLDVAVKEATRALRDTAGEALRSFGSEDESGEPSIDADAVAVSRATDEAVARIRAGGRKARDAVARAASRIDDLTGTLVTAAQQVPAGVEGDLAERLGQINHAGDLGARLLESLADASDRIDLHVVDGDYLSPTDLAASADQEVISLREQAERDLELAQIGLAVEVVSHEFAETTAGIRQYLDELGPWAEANPQLAPIRRGLTSGFEHLDTYLALFTPLERRLTTEPVEISGAEVALFLERLFAERFATMGVELVATSAFRRHLFSGRPAVFYPVFVNLVDNATFWLRDRANPRRIELDAHGARLLVSDTGPGVARRDEDVIFEPGFTRKPGGRGLGLYISREVLRRNGWAIGVGTAAGGGAEFRLEPVATDEHAG